MRAGLPRGPGGQRVRPSGGATGQHAELPVRLRAAPPGHHRGPAGHRGTTRSSVPGWRPGPPRRASAGPATSGCIGRPAGRSSSSCSPPTPTRTWSTCASPGPIRVGHSQIRRIEAHYNDLLAASNGPGPHRGDGAEPDYRFDPGDTFTPASPPIADAPLGDGAMASISPIGGADDRRPEPPPPTFEHSSLGLAAVTDRADYDAPPEHDHLPFSDKETVAIDGGGDLDFEADALESELSSLRGLVDRLAGEREAVLQSVEPSPEVPTVGGPGPRFGGHGTRERPRERPARADARPERPDHRPPGARRGPAAALRDAEATGPAREGVDHGP